VNGFDQSDDPGKLQYDDLQRYQIFILNSTTNFGQNPNETTRDQPGMGR
jgi:hypothetical protein